MNKKGIAAGGLLGLVILGLMPILVGVLVIAMITGGGFVLPFMKIPWYIWTGLLLLLIFWLFKK